VDKTKAGIIIPNTAKKKPQEGTVIAVGSGKQVDGKLIPLDVKNRRQNIFWQVFRQRDQVGRRGIYAELDKAATCRRPRRITYSFETETDPIR
jgi:chaperonin subunit